MRLGRNQRLLLEAVADGRPPGGDKHWSWVKLSSTMRSLETLGLVTLEAGRYQLTDAAVDFLHPSSPLPVGDVVELAPDSIDSDTI